MPEVFIRYSRKDFHFAESLAFHLDREGDPRLGWTRIISHRVAIGQPKLITLWMKRKR